MNSYFMEMIAREKIRERLEEAERARLLDRPPRGDGVIAVLILLIALALAF